MNFRVLRICVEVLAELNQVPGERKQRADDIQNDRQTDAESTRVRASLFFSEEHKRRNSVRHCEDTDDDPEDGSHFVFVELDEQQRVASRGAEGEGDLEDVVEDADDGEDDVGTGIIKGRLESSRGIVVDRSV